MSAPEKIQTEVVVLGSGPGGYTAAFRASDLGKKVILIERYPNIGGVCLNVGCIPSKAILHFSKVISEVEELQENGISSITKVDGKAVRKWTEGIIKKLTGGLTYLSKQRKVEILKGHGSFISAYEIEVKDQDGNIKIVSFENAIIAVGSQPIMIPGLPDDPRVLDSTSALLLDNVPDSMLIIGGGIIGLEVATMYEALGTKITIVEMMDGLVAGCDPDIVRPFYNRIKSRYENIYLNTSVTKVTAKKDALVVNFEGKDAPKEQHFGAVLVAVGRRPNGNKISAERAGVNVDERGFITVDHQQRTNIPNIYAVGDVTGQPMLAHKSSHEAKVAAEIIAGLKASSKDRLIPAVCYTDPEIAWVGVTEIEAKKNDLTIETGIFPWAANGRSLTLGRDEGITKLVFDKETNRIIGAAIVGPSAGDLIAECTLAINMGCKVEDLEHTIRPHPSLSETVGMAAEMYSGNITDLYAPKS